MADFITDGGSIPARIHTGNSRSFAKINFGEFFSPDWYSGE